MIKIDLGRGAFEPKSGLSKSLESLNIPPEVSARLQKLTSDIGTLVALAIGVGVALLFPLIEKQIKMQIRSDYEVKIKEQADKKTQLDSEIVKFNSYKAELESFNNQKKVVSERLQAVRSLLDQRGTPVNVLDTIGQSLPATVWLHSLDLVITGETPQINMAGTSLSNEDISDFVEKLNESIYLSDISLDDVTSKQEDKVELKTFTITAKPKIKLGLLAAATPNNAVKNEAGAKSIDPTKP